MQHGFVDPGGSRTPETFVCCSVSCVLCNFRPLSPVFCHQEKDDLCVHVLKINLFWPKMHTGNSVKKKTKQNSKTKTKPSGDIFPLHQSLPGAINWWLRNWDIILKSFYASLENSVLVTWSPYLGKASYYSSLTLSCPGRYCPLEFEGGIDFYSTATHCSLMNSTLLQG